MANGPLLVVGLGNPGPQYEKTRHNVGFMSLERLAEALDGSKWTHKAKLKAEISEASLKSSKVLLAKPQTFMNESGQAVSELMRFYKIPAENVVVIYDDKDIAFCAMKVQSGGGSAGHNGIKSLPADVKESSLRIRIGVHNELVEKMDTADFVLANFTKEELQTLNSTVLAECSVLAIELLEPLATRD